ncbi:MAG: uracil-DNA glycosylase [Flavobacteriales bacterium]|nr:uracil-DNA glycosylase [Flavobacteriales bacterium]
MEVHMSDGWKSLLQTEFIQPYFIELVEFVKSEYRSHTCYPPGKQIFSAFDHCTPDRLKVVILGQDPYHGPGQANGLCFSVADHVAMPPSLKNIFKEVQADVGSPIPTTGNLSRWADQGVLLLNATLTVRGGAAGSHQGKGWEIFTDAVVRTINDRFEHVVFMLWGNYAKKKGAIIDTRRHLVLTSAHPSPLAGGAFAGNKHFSQANAYLLQTGKQPILW